MFQAEGKQLTELLLLSRIYVQKFWKKNNCSQEIGKNSPK